MPSDDLAAWLAAARRIYETAFTGARRALRVVIADAEDPSAAVAYLLPLPAAGDVAASGIAIAEMKPGPSLPVYTLDQFHPVPLSTRERAILESVANGPLHGGDIALVLHRQRLLVRGRGGKWPGSFRTLLSRMARSRGLLIPPCGVAGYGLSPLGRISLDHPEQLDLFAGPA
jgi:hypothetical protein